MLSKYLRRLFQAFPLFRTIINVLVVVVVVSDVRELLAVHSEIRFSHIRIARLLFSSLPFPFPFGYCVPLFCTVDTVVLSHPPSPFYECENRFEMCV